MKQNVYPPGSLVQVTGYSPFRGLKGTVQVVDTIVDDLEEPFCFQIALEGTQLKEPMWFEYGEVGLVLSPLIALEA